MRKTTQQSAIRTRSLFTALFFTFLTWLGPHQAKAAEVLLDLEATTAESVLIGDDIFVAWPAATPHMDWTLELLDSSGASLASMHVTSTEGGIEAFLFWPASGVVNCDLVIVDNLLADVFENFEAAAEALAGKTFQIAVKPKGSNQSTTTISFTFALPGELFYFSDDDGCVRTSFSLDESIFLSRWRGPSLPTSVRFFLVADGEYLPGSNLEDVRQNFSNQPQKFVRDSGNMIDVLGEVIEAGDLDCGTSYFGIVRPFSDSDGLLMETGDVFALPPKSVLPLSLATGSNSGVEVEPWDPSTKGPGCFN